MFLKEPKNEAIGVLFAATIYTGDLQHEKKNLGANLDNI